RSSGLREAGVVLPASGGHPLDRRLGLVPRDAARGQLVGQLLARMLAPHQQAQRTLGRGGLRPAPAAASGAGRHIRGHRTIIAFGRRHRSAQALASSSSASFSTTAGASFSRSAASILAATAGLSLRYWRAFSLP